METDRLRYFCAIVDSGSMTGAADALGVSHSGLSKAMSVLQSEVGVSLFRPQGRGLVLTDDGRALYEKSREILSLVSSLRGAPVVSRGARVGLPEVLALALAGAASEFAGEGLTIDEMDSGEIEARLIERKLDFGFTFVPFPHRELEHLKLASVTFETFAKRGAFAKAAAEEIPYVVPSTELRDNPLSLKIKDGWNSSLKRAAPFRANTLSIGLEIARSGASAIYIPEFIAGDLVRVASARAKEKSKRDVFLVKRAGEDETREMKRVTRAIRQICSR